MSDLFLALVHDVLCLLYLFGQASEAIWCPRREGWNLDCKSVPCGLSLHALLGEREGLFEVALVYAFLGFLLGAVVDIEAKVVSGVVCLVVVGGEGDGASLLCLHLQAQELAACVVVALGLYWSYLG